MSQYLPDTAPPRGLTPLRIGIVAAEWNAHIINPMIEGVIRRLAELGYSEDAIEVFRVPGTIELTFGASQLIEASAYDAIVVFGVVIRGDTPHFDYVCQSVTQGITSLNADCDIPVIFGVLTVENEQQAIERIGKGAECIDAALKMVNFARSI